LRDEVAGQLGHEVYLSAVDVAPGRMGRF